MQPLRVDMTGTSCSPHELVVSDRGPDVLETAKPAFHTCEVQTKASRLPRRPPRSHRSWALGRYTATRGTGVPAAIADPLGAQVELLTRIAVEGGRRAVSEE